MYTRLSHVKLYTPGLFIYYRTSIISACVFTVSLLICYFDVLRNFKLKILLS